MKILLAGRMDGWMGVYLDQLADGFRKEGVECRTFNYRGIGPGKFLRRLLPGDQRERQRQIRTAVLIKALRRYKPHALLLQSINFDFAAIRDAFKGILVYWDMDGPAGPLGSGDIPDFSTLDKMFTISRQVERRVSARNGVKVHYIPHGADVAFYRETRPSASARQRFASPLAFLGRPTERRVRHLTPLADEGLVVWGRRWGKPPWRDRSGLSCHREKRNIMGKDVAALYQCAGVMLNICREAFSNPPTTLNLQVFHVPAAGACLLTEWVEELEDAFEPEKEVVTFRTIEEFVEKARIYSHDEALRKRVAEAGQRRCMAHHDLRIRASEVMRLLQRD